jgi:multidrug efflux pump subunit AcrA (membrane-fusion protein)
VATGPTLPTGLLTRLRARPKSVLALLVLIGLAVTAAFVRVGSNSVPDLPTAEVTRGQFVDAIEIRGDIRPLKSIVLSAPMQSGELQIVKLAKNGSMVKAGDVVVEFDASTLRRTMQEKQSELKQAEAEIEQSTAQSRITKEQNATELMRSKYNIQRSKLDVNKGDTVSRIENEQAKLTLRDNEQKLAELEAKMNSDSTSTEADLSSKRRKREKALFDFQRAERGIQNLQLRAPAAGMVNILTNYRASGPWGGQEVEFREGDRAWPGAAIMELPDLTSVHLEARLEEADRGRLKVGQAATIRIEAIPGREFKATIERISVLAKIDYSSGWPPARNFELGLVLDEIDPKIRPGMSAVARIATDLVPDVLLVPSESLFQHDGHSVVYKLAGSQFVEQQVQVSRRGKELAIVAGGVTTGDRVATRKPPPELIRRKA